MENIIEVNQLTKTFQGITAVDHVSFEVKRGELFGFLGVNGAGKSTTINMLSTLYQMTSGLAHIGGIMLGKDDKEIRKKIGVVFQENTLDERLTVKENLISRGYLYEKDGKIIKENLKRISKVLELDDFLNQRFGKLSGGQKRRCEIARALLHKPEILFLDEPTTGLDPKTRQMVWNSILYLKKMEGITIFLTTHYMEEASGAEHVVVLDKGKIVADSTPFQLKANYATDKLRIEVKKEEECPILVESEKNHKEEIMKILIQNGLRAVEETNCITVALPTSIHAISILQIIKQHISAFEVVQGTMEDAFLNITGKKELMGGLE